MKLMERQGECTNENEIIKTYSVQQVDERKEMFSTWIILSFINPQRNLNKGIWTLIAVF